MDNYISREETMIHHDGDYYELFRTLVTHIMSKYNEKNFNELHLHLSINDEVYSFYETIEQDEEDFLPIHYMVHGFIKSIVTDIVGEDLERFSRREVSDFYSVENSSVAHLVTIS